MLLLTSGRVMVLGVQWGTTDVTTLSTFIPKALKA